MRNRNTSLILRLVSVLFLSGAIILTILALVGYSRQRDSYPPGMTIAGVPVGGVDPATASQRVLQVYSTPVQVEYAGAVFERKKGKMLFVTFVTDVSPLCDCYPFSDQAIVPDVGILASIDPVAIDRAAVDLVNGAPGNPLSKLGEATGPGKDKFRALFPHIDWEHQLTYAQELGLGSTEYKLVHI